MNVRKEWNVVKKISSFTLCEKQKWPLEVQQTSGVNNPRPRDTRPCNQDISTTATSSALKPQSCELRSSILYVTTTWGKIWNSFGLPGIYSELTLPTVEEDLLTQGVTPFRVARMHMEEHRQWRMWEAFLPLGLVLITRNERQISVWTKAYLFKFEWRNFEREIALASTIVVRSLGTSQAFKLRPPYAINVARVTWQLYAQKHGIGPAACANCSEAHTAIIKAANTRHGRQAANRKVHFIGITTNNTFLRGTSYTSRLRA
jgi:hypothetical protein